MEKELAFKDAMKRLDDITSSLQQNEIPLEESIQLFEERLQLIHRCDTQLKGFEDKIEALMSKYKEGES